MIRNTFCHLPRMGRTSERRLWENGILTWKDFLEAEDVPRVSAGKKLLLDEALRRAGRALADGDSGFFRCLPSTEQWRLWEEYREEACFIDIETNHHNNITVLGIADASGRVFQFVRHHNMDGREIRRVLAPYKCMVTFNGASFDLPIIRRYFSDVLPGVPHIDLRHAAARAGLTGGLKSVEREIGLSREEHVQGVTGADALKLWAAYRQTGEERFRDILLDYNAEDVINLKPLADAVFSRLIERTLPLPVARYAGG